eukprot:UN22750
MWGPWLNQVVPLMRKMGPCLTQLSYRLLLLFLVSSPRFSFEASHHVNAKLNEKKMKKMLSLLKSFFELFVQKLCFRSQLLLRLQANQQKQNFAFKSVI